MYDHGHMASKSNDLVTGENCMKRNAIGRVAIFTVGLVGLVAVGAGFGGAPVDSAERHGPWAEQPIQTDHLDPMASAAEPMAQCGPTANGGYQYCSGGLACCSGNCVDTCNSFYNCGECGNSCTRGEVCNRGFCCPDGAYWSFDRCACCPDGDCTGVADTGDWCTDAPYDACLIR